MTSKYLSGEDEAPDQVKEKWSSIATLSKRMSLFEVNIDGSDNLVKCLEYE
jgi:hypothetical protein